MPSEKFKNKSFLMVITYGIDNFVINVSS